MASIFRPWMKSEVSCVQQDDTVSTTTALIKENAESTDDSRHVRYNCIKEHVRERSEKKLRRSRQSQKHPTTFGCNETANSDQLLPHVAPLSFPPIPHIPSYPSLMDAYSAQLLGFVNDAGKDCWEDLSVSSPELVDAALAQGIPPVVLEEYVRLMTEQQRQIAERNRKQRPKKFRCPHCQVGFSNNGQLKGHIRIHTGERPFKCEAEHCGKSFTRNEELTRHRRIHSGLRPFPCPDCGKRFGRKDHLKKHVRTHYQQRYQLLPIIPSHYPFLLGI